MNTKRIAFVTFTFASLAWTSDASAATKYWKDSIPIGAWSTSTNWSAVSAAGTDNGGAPVASEPALIVHTNGVAHTVTVFGSTPSLGHLMIDLTGAGATTNTLTISNNVTLTAASIFVGGHNGVSLTNGRGAVNQSNGSVTTPAGHALVVGYGTGSTGTYTLSGSGQFIPGDSEHIGYFGNGTFNHSGGSNTLNNGVLIVGSAAGGVGTYNLSGTGQLISNTSQYIADHGTGFFNQTGGSNTINGANDLILGHNAGGNGTYTLSGGSLTAPQAEYIGFYGSGTFHHSAGLKTLSAGGSGGLWVGFNAGSTGTYNLSGTGQLISNKPEYVGDQGTGFFNQTGGSNTINAGYHLYLGVDINNNSPTGGTYTLSAGTLAVNSGDEYIGYNRVGNFNQTGGTNTVAGNLYVGFNAGSTGTYDQTGGTNTINGYLIIGESAGGNGTYTLSGTGSLSAGTTMIGRYGSGALEITDGGTMNSTEAFIGAQSSGSGSVLVSGAGSTWTIANFLETGFFDSAGTLTIEDKGLVHIGTTLVIRNQDVVNLNGGTIRFDSYFLPDNGGVFNFNAGTIQLAGSRTVGADPEISEFFASHIVPTGKGLTVEQTATLSTLLTIDGGTFSASQLVNAGLLDLRRGTLNITNQEVTIGSGGLFGAALDVNEDVTINVTQGITNQGLVTGDGQIGGPFINGVSGELRASAGQSLKLTGTTYSYGQIKLLGGELESTEHISTAPGSLISGNGTIITRLGFFNQGVMNFAGTANIVGDVNNSAGGRIISGGGGATVFFDDVVNNAEIRTSANGFTVFFGSVSGSGTFTGTGTVNFEGDLKPGSSPAAVSFGGDVSFGVEASLEIEIGGLTAGSQHDKLSIAGDLALDGELEVSLINGFNPSAGQSFNILDWGSLAGTFSSISLPTLAGLSWNTSQLYTTGVLSVAAAGLLGDFNKNGTVDAADYVVWRKGLGTTYTQNDYNTWRANFGATLGSGSGATDSASANAAIPEPSTLLLTIFAGAALLSRRKAAQRRQPLAVSLGTRRGEGVSPRNSERIIVQAAQRRHRDPMAVA